MLFRCSKTKFNAQENRFKTMFLKFFKRKKIVNASTTSSAVEHTTQPYVVHSRSSISQEEKSMSNVVYIEPASTDVSRNLTPSINENRCSSVTNIGNETIATVHAGTTTLKPTHDSEDTQTRNRIILSPNILTSVTKETLNSPSPIPARASNKQQKTFIEPSISITEKLSQLLSSRTTKPTITITTDDDLQKQIEDIKGQILYRHSLNLESSDLIQVLFEMFNKDKPPENNVGGGSALHLMLPKPTASKKNKSNIQKSTKTNVSCNQDDVDTNNNGSLNTLSPAANTLSPALKTLSPGQNTLLPVQNSLSPVKNSPPLKRMPQIDID